MRATTAALLLSVVLNPLVVAADYFPLQQGNRWIYAMSNGIQMTTTVTGFADVGDVRCAVVETTMGWQTSREYVAADAEGLKAYMSQAQGQEFRYDPPLLRIKLPYRQGDTWATAFEQFGMSLTTEFRSTGRERVQTAVGTFDCIKVRSTVTGMPGQSPMVSVVYYADGIGPVLQTMQMGGQELTASLTATNVEPAPKSPEPRVEGTPPSDRGQDARETERPRSSVGERCPRCGAKANPSARFCPECGKRLAKPPAPTTPTNCPKCSAKLPAGARFCPGCGQKIAVPAVEGQSGSPAESSVDSPPLEKYRSEDGRVLLYKPAEWSVTAGDMFGEGVYAVSVMEPQEDAVVLFMTFSVNEGIEDSVALAARCIGALREEFPDLKATDVKSTPERQRTVAELTLTAEGERGIGRGYFFHTERIGTVYLLLAKAQQWDHLHPTLTTVAANLAYAPQGIGTVQEQGRQLAEDGPAAPEGSVLSPAAMIKRASEQSGKQVELQPAALQDRSMTLQIPQGWTLQGQKLRFVAMADPQTGTHGVTSVCHTIIPMEMPVPGAINAPYQPPAQALELVIEFGKVGSDVQILAELPAEEVLPEVAQTIRQMRAQGWQVDARLMHVRYRNANTGAMMRGLFSVQCSTMPMSPVWQVAIDGSWAPDDEYDEWLPVYLRVGKSAQVNQQWFQQEMRGRAATQQQLNRNLQNSIAESNRAFDDYMESLRDADRSRDYTSHMWSQTTLGQGTWVAENEGAKVYETDSWGIEGPEGRIDSPAYNTTNFTGENPWAPGDLELVDTRAEYERYIAGPQP